MCDEVEISCGLSKIAKLNGDFRKNYGTLLGALPISEIHQCGTRTFLAVGRLVFPYLLGRARMAR